MEQVNVAIADDNERILDLLEEIINMDKELHVVGKAKNGEEMCQIIRNKQPDVVLFEPDHAENGWSDCDGEDQSG